MISKYSYPIVVDKKMVDFFELLEGFRSKPYLDKYSKWTVGIGHNLTDNPLKNHILFHIWPPADPEEPLINNDKALELMKKNGISKDDAKYILNDDIVDIDLNFHMKFPRYNQIDDDIRHMALLYMGFNIGTNGVLKFKKFCDYFYHKKYSEAADEIVNSQWYKQVPYASKCVEGMIRNNEIPKEYEDAMSK